MSLRLALALLCSGAAFGQEITVVTFLSAVCPVTNSYNVRLNDLYRDYAPKGVKFVFLNSNQNEPEAQVREHARSAGFAFPVGKDSENAMAGRLGAQLTPETFVLDRAGAVRYRGRIDDSQNPARVKHHSLRLAIDAVLAGRAVAAPETKAFGCTIKRAPGLSPIDESGYREMLKSNRGSVTLVDFWATWCAPCREETPLLAKMEDRFRDKGFRLVTISADEPENERAAASFLGKSGVTGRAYLRRAKNDDKFINAIDPKWSGALPGLFLYDRAGKLVRSFVGEIGMAEVEGAIRRLL